MKCPHCGSPKTRPNGDKLHYCVRCAMLFDESGDDGDIGYGRPDKIAERREGPHKQNHGPRKFKPRKF